MRSPYTRPSFTSTQLPAPRVQLGLPGVAGPQFGLGAPFAQHRSWETGMVPEWGDGKRLPALGTPGRRGSAPRAERHLGWAADGSGRRMTRSPGAGGREFLGDLGLNVPIPRSHAGVVANAVVSRLMRIRKRVTKAFIRWNSPTGKPPYIWRIHAWSHSQANVRKTLRRVLADKGARGLVITEHPGPDLDPQTGIPGWYIQIAPASLAAPPPSPEGEGDEDMELDGYGRPRRRRRRRRRRSSGSDWSAVTTEPSASQAALPPGARRPKKPENEMERQLQAWSPVVAGMLREMYALDPNTSVEVFEAKIANLKRQRRNAPVFLRGYLTNRINILEAKHRGASHQRQLQLEEERSTRTWRVLGYSLTGTGIAVGLGLLGLLVVSSKSVHRGDYARKNGGRRRRRRRSR